MKSNLVGITMGDPAGIGPEISLKAIDAKPEYQQSVLIYGSYDVLQYYHQQLQLTTPLVRIEKVQDFQPGKINVISVVDLAIGKDIEIGQVSPIAGDAAYQYIARAISDALKGDIRVVTTAPLNKEALHKGGHNFDGHTEIYAHYTHTEKYTMLLAHHDLRVVHVSTHCSLREACDRVEKQRVLDVIHIADSACRSFGIPRPRIAVAGLNPHAGENGLFGREELDEIIPAIRAAQDEGLCVDGPVPPDSLFPKALGGWYDIVVAMYHDQGHIPLKTVGFVYDREKQAWKAVEGVNITLGLPIIRTSVDHGTGFDQAGKGTSNELSLLNAIQYAVTMARNRNIKE